MLSKLGDITDRFVVPHKESIPCHHMAVERSADGLVNGLTET